MWVRNSFDLRMNIKIFNSNHPVQKQVWTHVLRKKKPKRERNDILSQIIEFLEKIRIKKLRRDVYCASLYLIKIICCLAGEPAFGNLQFFFTKDWNCIKPEDWVSEISSKMYSQIVSTVAHNPLIFIGEPSCLQTDLSSIYNKCLLGNLQNVS